MSNETDGTVDVPEAALVRCPKQRFALTKVSACVDCSAFGGLEDRFPGGSHAFEVRFSVRCYGEPVKREILSLAG